MGFFDIIQAYFTQVTGRFIMFSGRDVALLYDWREQGATAASVCRGIRDAVRLFDRTDPPRSVHNCRKFIDPYIKRTRQRVVAEEGPLLMSTAASTGDKDNVARRALRMLERAGHACEQEDVRMLYRATWYDVRALVEEHSVDAQYAGLLKIEEHVADSAFALLSEVCKEALHKKVKVEVGTLNLRMSEEAWSRHALARRRHLMVTEYGIVSLLP